MGEGEAGDGNHISSVVALVGRRGSWIYISWLLIEQDRRRIHLIIILLAHASTRTYFIFDIVPFGPSQCKRMTYSLLVGRTLARFLLILAVLSYLVEFKRRRVTTSVCIVELWLLALC